MCPVSLTPVPVVSLPPPRPLRVCVRVCTDDPCGNLQPEQESSASWTLLCKAAAIMGCAARGSVNGILNRHVREASGRARQEPPAGDPHRVHRRPDCCWHGGTGGHLSAQGSNSLGLDLGTTCNTLATNRHGSCPLRCRSASRTYLIRKQHPRKAAWKTVGNCWASPGRLPRCGPFIAPSATQQVTRFCL